MYALHPVVQALSLSPQQLAAIQQLNTDALITAGAGTGKTRTLTAHYLNLLARGFSPREVVAITFTRKAAREMRNRIRKEVWAYAAREDIAADERAKWSDLAIQLDAARISTFHGLCQEILRSHPAEAGVDPDFQTLEESRSLLLREDAVEEALTWGASENRIADLLATEAESQVRAAVRMLLGRGSEAKMLLLALPDDMDALLAQWREWLLREQRRRLQALMQDSSWRDAKRLIEATTPLDRSDGLAVQHALAKEALLALASIENRDDFHTSVRTLAAINVGSGKMGAWPGGKLERDAVKSALKTLRAPFKQEGWLGASLNQEDVRAARALVQLKAVTLEAMRVYQLKKQDIQALDFDDLEFEALRLLTTHEEVRSWWQNQIRALLVDEFQDTNARQTELLQLLDGGRGIQFLVGDGKQSIYRFRGADVAIFRELRQRFIKAGKRVSSLDETWRAHKELVYGLNHLMRPILGEAREPWEAPFEALHPARSAPPQCPQPPYIEFQLVTGAKQQGALEQAARAAVQRLQTLFAAGECQPGHVAILTRASTSFSAYEDALDAAGIPFLTLAGRGFYQRPEIRDLVVVMRVAADPSDDVALVGALRSPGLGLSDVAIYQLARTRDVMQREDGAPVSLWQALPLVLSQLDEVELERMQRALQLIRRLHSQAGRISVADLLKQYLDETGYLAIFAAAGQDRAMRNIDKLVEEVRVAGFVHVQEFIEYVKLARAAAVREGEAPVITEGAVQIMTVHRAKGLEFPVVVLGDVSYQGKDGDGLLVTDSKIAWKLPAAPGSKERPTFYEALDRLEKRMNEAEQKRLLYVAVTRAKEMLIINGVATNAGWMEFLSQSIPELEECVGRKVTAPRQLDVTLADSSIPVRCTLIASELPIVLQRDLQRVAQKPPMFDERMLKRIDGKSENVDEKLKAAEAKPERRIWRVLPREDNAWAPSWVVGTLVHRSIELERFPEDPHFDAWFRSSARGLGLSDEGMLRNALMRARRTLEQLSESEIWRQIVSADQRIHEIPYVFNTPEGCLERGAIDLAWQKDGVWQLVDFKTDRVNTRDEMLARIEEKHYRRQVQRYIRAMEVLRGVTPTAWICFLNVGGRVELEQVAPATEFSCDEEAEMLLSVVDDATM